MLMFIAAAVITWISGVAVDSYALANNQLQLSFPNGGKKDFNNGGSAQ